LKVITAETVMRFFNGLSPALLVGVLLYRLDVVFAEVKLVEGEVHAEDYKEIGDNEDRKVPFYEGPYRGGSRQRENSGETRDYKDRKDNSRGGSYEEELKKTGDIKDRKVPHYEGPYMGGSRQRENSGESRDEKGIDDDWSSRGGPYGGIYDKTKDGRTEDNVDKGDAQNGSYGTYGTYGGSVPTEDLTSRPIQRRRKYPTAKPTSQPRSATLKPTQHGYPTLKPTSQPRSTSFPTDNEFDASESTFQGGYSIPKKDTPYTPEYVSPYAQYIPPNKEMPYVPKEDVPSYDQKNPQYVPRYTPPADDASAKHPPFFFGCQCCPPPPPPPPPPPRCTPYCQGPSWPGPGPPCPPYCRPRSSYQTPGSYQQPHQGYGSECKWAAPFC
jgi:hypothetical protein